LLLFDRRSTSVLREAALSGVSDAAFPAFLVDEGAEFFFDGVFLHRR